MKCNVWEHASAGLSLADASRRDFMQLSFASALGMAITSGSPLSALASETKVSAHGVPKGPKGPNDRSVIVLWLSGGASHIDSFDPKSGCEEAGPYKQIDTALAGVRFTERVPMLAARADKLAIVRSVTSEEGEHNRAQFYANTGYRPLSSLNVPTLGSIVSHELGPRTMRRATAVGLPNFIAINDSKDIDGGYLGLEHSGFHVANPSQPPKNVMLAGGLSETRFRERHEMLMAFEKMHPMASIQNASARRQSGQDSAIALMRSPNLKVFDLDQEPSKVRERYGSDPFGKGCLLARRLVESGVRCVRVGMGGWDSHTENFKTHDKLLPRLDQGFAALLDDLGDRGLLEHTTVVCMGEFGRTPRINGNSGRDHFPRAWSMVLAGAGIKAGQVYGSTDAKGAAVATDPVSLADLFATICEAVDIDHHQEFMALGNRPTKLVNEGKAVQRLLSGSAFA